jgi:hypothetical protein
MILQLDRTPVITESMMRACKDLFDSRIKNFKIGSLWSFSVLFHTFSSDDFATSPDDNFLLAHMKFVNSALLVSGH